MHMGSTDSQQKDADQVAELSVGHRIAAFIAEIREDQDYKNVHTWRSKIKEIGVPMPDVVSAILNAYELATEAKFKLCLAGIFLAAMESWEKNILLDTSLRAVQAGLIDLNGQSRNVTQAIEAIQSQVSLSQNPELLRLVAAVK
jgi:hypothetical protein